MVAEAASQEGDQWCAIAPAPGCDVGTINGYEGLLNHRKAPLYSFKTTSRSIHRCRKHLYVGGRTLPFSGATSGTRRNHMKCASAAPVEYVVRRRHSIPVQNVSAIE